MNLQEKIEYLKSNHLDKWVETRSEVELKLSDQNKMFCVCGKLATGLHERSCKKFNKQVDHDTVKRLEHLIK